MCGLNLINENVVDTHMEHYHIIFLIVVSTSSISFAFFKE